MTPYRISARESKPRAAAPLALATTLRVAGRSFVAVAVASALAMMLVDARDVRLSVSISIWADRVFAIVVPVLAVAIGARATKDARLRTWAFATAAAWLITDVARLPQVGFVESNVLAGSVAVARVLATAGLALLPSVAARRQVLPRWPVFAVIALAAGDASDHLALGSFPALLAQIDPSLTSILLFALLAWTFFGAARALSGETIDDRVERRSEDAGALFPDGRARAAFLGPVRLATDAALAFAVAGVGHSRSFRLDEHTAGVAQSALVVIVMGALVWHHRSWKRISAAPVVAALIATIAAVASTATGSTMASSVALLPFGLAILGLGVVAPRTSNPDTRTMRRWVKLVSAMGVMFASAGFFALYSRSCGQGEPFLAHIGKLGAVVFGIMAANASAKIELHARVELAAEDREP